MVGLYGRAGHLYLSVMHQTTAGLWIGGPEPIVIHGSVSDAELGAEIMSMLAKSTIAVPHPCSFDDDSKPLLDAAGVGSWNEFVRGAGSMTVSDDNGVCSVEKWRKSGSAFVDAETIGNVVVGDNVAMGRLVKEFMFGKGKSPGRRA